MPQLHSPTSAAIHARSRRMLEFLLKARVPELTTPRKWPDLVYQRLRIRKGGSWQSGMKATRIWEPDETLLSTEDLESCSRACDDDRYCTPIPTQMISNGEYLPTAPRPRHKRRSKRVSASSPKKPSRRLGISRRRFLAGTGGMDGIPSSPSTKCSDLSSRWTRWRCWCRKPTRRRDLPKTCSCSMISCTWCGVAAAVSCAHCAASLKAFDPA